MKRLLMTLAFSLFLLDICSGQNIPAEAFTLTNSLSDLWEKGETEKAIESSLELYSLYSPFFFDRIHDGLSQQLQRNSASYEYGRKYLKGLADKKNEKINQVIAPFYLWAKSIGVRNKADCAAIVKTLKSILKDSVDYDGRSARYYLLTLQELDKRNGIDKKAKEEILQKNIRNLELYPYIAKAATSRVEQTKRGWYRYLLAYSYNYLYTLEPNLEMYLKKASDYSPDLNDRQYKHAYFYDAALLTGNVSEFGFQSKYQKYLVENNRQAEALNLMSNIAFGDPSDDNIKALQASYEKVEHRASFKDYWTSYVHKIGKPVPKVKIKFENEELDLTMKPNKWIYIDVWGTWCNPCVKELPELQSFFVENNVREDPKLKVYTFSFASQDLHAFMANNKYTFPVSEIDKETTALFEVSGYPTKILISPDGNFIQIPFGVDWKMYIRNYTLM